MFSVVEFAGISTCVWGVILEKDKIQGLELQCYSIPFVPLEFKDDFQTK